MKDGVFLICHLIGKQLEIFHRNHTITSVEDF